MAGSFLGRAVHFLAYYPIPSSPSSGFCMGDGGCSLGIKPDTGSLSGPSQPCCCPIPSSKPDKLLEVERSWGLRFHQERGPYHCSWNPDSGMTSVSWLGVISLVLNTPAPARSRVLSTKDSHSCLEFWDPLSWPLSSKDMGV